MPLPEPAAELFAAQHHVAARTQLRHCCPEEAIDCWPRAGIVRRVYRGVWALYGSRETDHQRLMAAILRCGPDARANGMASCWLLGLEGFEPAVGVVVPKGCQVTGAPFPVKATVLAPADCRTVDNIPCLTAARALIEVAPVINDKGLRVAFDSARRGGLLTVDRLRARALELESHVGGRIVLRMLGSGAADQDGEGERVLARFLRGVDGIEWGVEDVVPKRRLDAFMRNALLVLEYDGRDHHVLPTDRDADGLRDIEVRSVTVDGMHLEVIRITKGMLDRAPDQVREFVLRRRDERRRELAAARVVTAASDEATTRS